MNQDRNTKVSLRNVVIFAGAYCAFSIGSGYATGQEILQFFGISDPFPEEGVIGNIIHRGSCAADNPRFFVQQSAFPEVKQGGNQFSACKIAGCPENHYRIWHRLYFKTESAAPFVFATGHESTFLSCWNMFP